MLDIITLAVLDVFEDWRRAKARWGAINDFLALATVTRDERAAARKLARQLCKAMLVGIGPLREHFRTTWEKGLAAARVRRMRDYVRYGGTDEYGEPLLDPRRLEPAARALHVDPDDIEAAVLMRRDKIKPYVIWHEIVGAVSGPVGVRAVEARAADAPVGLDAFFDSIVDDDDGGLFFDDERKKLRRFEWPKK